MRWGDRPVWARCTAAVYVAGFLEGTGAHAYFLLTDGINAYDYAPLLVGALFHVLLLLDPGIFVLLMALPLQRALACGGHASAPGTRQPAR